MVNIFGNEDDNGYGYNDYLIKTNAHQESTGTSYTNLAGAGAKPNYVQSDDARAGSEFKYYPNVDFLSLLTDIKPDKEEYERDNETLKKVALFQAAGDLAKHLGNAFGGGYAPVEKRQDNQRLYGWLNKIDHGKQDFRQRLRAYREKEMQMKLADMQEQRGLYEAGMNRAQARNDAAAQFKNQQNLQDYGIRLQNNTKQTQTTDSRSEQTPKNSLNGGRGSDYKNNVVFVDPDNNVRYEMQKKDAQAVVSALVSMGYLKQEESGGILNRVLGNQTWDGNNERWQDAMMRFRRDAASGIIKNGRNATQEWDRLMDKNIHIVRLPIYYDGNVQVINPKQSAGYIMGQGYSTGNNNNNNAAIPYQTGQSPQTPKKIKLYNYSTE